MGGPEIREHTADAERRVTRRDVCMACDQCIKRPAMPLACALVVNPDRDYEPCAAKLARMQAHPHAKCPHQDEAQRAKWSAAELTILGRPVYASPPGQPRPTAHAPARKRIFRGTPHTGATPIYTRRARKM